MFEEHQKEGVYCEDELDCYLKQDNFLGYGLKYCQLPHTNIAGISPI